MAIKHRGYVYSTPTGHLPLLCFWQDFENFLGFQGCQNQSVVNAFHYVCSTKEHAKLNNIKEKWKNLPENMLLQEISRNYIHIQHQALNFLWFKKKWVVDVVAPTIFSYTLSYPDFVDGSKRRWCFLKRWWCFLKRRASFFRKASVLFLI